MTHSLYKNNQIVHFSTSNIQKTSHQLIALQRCILAIYIFYSSTINIIFENVIIAIERNKVSDPRGWSGVSSVCVDRVKFIEKRRK